VRGRGADFAPLRHAINRVFTMTGLIGVWGGDGAPGRTLSGSVANRSFAFTTPPGAAL